MKRELWKIAYIITSFVTATGLRFSLLYLLWEYRKMGVFWGIEGRGRRRGPWGMKPQGPENLLLFDFLQKLFSAKGMIFCDDHTSFLNILLLCNRCL